MRHISIVFAFLLLPLAIDGQYLPEPMVPLRLVNDFTGLLSVDDQIALNQKLLTFNNETSTQIFVVTYDSLQGYDIADYAVRLAEKWGIGQKGKDNGILLMVSPANQKVTIQTGYGLEGAVPDLLCSRLIRDVIKPEFSAGRYYAGLDSTTNVLMSLTQGEFTADNYMKSSKEIVPAIVFILIILFFFVFILISRNRRRFYSPGRSIPWWMLGAGGVGNSGWGSFTSGSGSFGGFGGGGGFGGFGGGGGGGFGGGGASGGW